VSSFRSRTSLLALIGGLCSGCSAVFLTPPPAQPAGFARPHVDCTTSYLLPILDSAVTAYELAGVAYVSTLDDSRFRNYPISRQADMAVGAAFAAAFAGSAIYGYVSAARCRRIRRGPPAPDYLPGVSSRAGPTRDAEAPFSRHRSRPSAALAAAP
jgi:hypothetical protein